MIVVVHQTVGVAQPTMQADHPRQGGEKLPTVSVIVDDALAGKAETLFEQNVRLQDLTLFTRMQDLTLFTRMVHRARQNGV